MQNISSIVEEILKESTDVSNVDPKISNRIKQIKKIYQQIKEIESTIKEQVGDLQKQAKDLEKQAQVFYKEILPILKDVEDHALEAEGIFIELKAGRRSPKVGYDLLASKVNSELLSMAEKAMTEAAQFAQKPTVKLTHVKTAGLGDWLKKQWNKLKSWVSSLKKQEKSIGKAVKDLKAATE